METSRQTMQEGLACAIHGIARREGQREALFSVLAEDGTAQFSSGSGARGRVRVTMWG